MMIRTSRNLARRNTVHFQSGWGLQGLLERPTPVESRRKGFRLQNIRQITSRAGVCVRSFSLRSNPRLLVRIARAINSSPFNKGFGVWGLGFGVWGLGFG